MRTASAICMTEASRVRTIGDMRRWESGWTVHWAYDPDEGTIGLDYSIGEYPTDVCNMSVACVEPGKLYRVWPEEKHPTEDCQGTARAVEREMVHFEDIAPRSFHVWTDLSLQEIESITGVSDVFKDLGRNEYHVYVDPRYGAEVVKREIRRAAWRTARRAARQKCCHGE